MSSESAFVYGEAWTYHSPDAADKRLATDIGLVAEALIFYDRVYFGHTADAHFCNVVAWFKSQGVINDFLDLLAEGVLVPYFYAFQSLPAENNGIIRMYNIQDEAARDTPVFAPRVLDTGLLDSIVRRRYLRNQIKTAAVDAHHEIKADDFGAAIRNAEADYYDAGRCTSLLQHAVDVLYRDLGYAAPPTMKVDIEQGQGGMYAIKWNVDFDEWNKHLDPPVQFHKATPLSGAVLGVKSIWSAASLDCDLYLGAPVAAYVAEKLEEGSRKAKTKAIIQELKLDVAFPDVRRLVNEGKMNLTQVLDLRRRAKDFRRWLRAESDFDRSAVHSYLGQLATEAGWKRGVRKVLSVSGMLGGSAAGAALAGPLGAVGGAFAGSALQYVVDLAAKFDGGWKPLAFGQFIETTMKDQ